MTTDHAADTALVAAISLEIRGDANHVRQRAAIEALRGLSEGLRSQAAEPSTGDS